LKNKKEREEKNKDPPKPTASLFESESDGDVLCVTTNENNCAVEWVFRFRLHLSYVSSSGLVFII